MSEAEDIQRLGELIGQIGLSEALLLLESGGGTGATSCCEGREAGKQDVRKCEAGISCPVAPGEAEARYRDVVLKLRKAAQNCERQTDEATFRHRTEIAKDYAGRAVAFRVAADWLRDAWPRPDSEARNERSGRRNPTGQEPEGFPAQDCSK